METVKQLTEELGLLCSLSKACKMTRFLGLHLRVINPSCNRNTQNSFAVREDSSGPGCSRHR